MMHEYVLLSNISSPVKVYSLSVILPIFKMKIKSNQREKGLSWEYHLCTLQSSHSPKSWQLHFILIYYIPHMAFFFHSFPLPLHPYHKAVWQSSLFSFKRMNEDKKQSKIEHERHHLLWFMIWPGSAVRLCSLPAWLPACAPARLLLPKRCNGEPQSSHSDTVKPSGMADYGAKYWSLPHMCQNSPHPLIRISPLRRTGTNRIY